MSNIAVFDDYDHADVSGWATYHKRNKGRFRCWWGHKMPDWTPIPTNGFAPSNYSNCQRCGVPVHWFVIGQHHWGGLTRYLIAALCITEDTPNE